MNASLRKLGVLLAAAALFFALLSVDAREAFA